ncbi:DUF2059 domain-containing protein [uncultured Thiothrix sp.]|uniref:DUF2059 domain-containing protein n=1 Tax=uncultured Thiothrix sp. TaxID=223185 RepID=UPI00261D21DF|nr:DUF2059 domain-containing protein [uncultured Thiothrix sp.]
MKVLFFLSIFSITSLAFALEDNLANRQQQATRYLEANPPKAMAQALADQNVSMLPEIDRKPYLDMLTKHLDIEVINQAMHAALVKYFTANELEVLANFYSNPDAKTALTKMDQYTSEVLPVLQTEMLKAQQKAFNAPEKDLNPEQSSMSATNKFP